MTSEDLSIAKDRKRAAAPGDSLVQTVAGMSDAELRELAGAVLSELRARIPDPASQGFSYQHLVSDLQRRLADAHTYARSGFGHRDKRLTKPAAGPRLSPPSAPLSEERKARVLVGLAAELLPDAGAAAAVNATADIPTGAQGPDGSGQPDGRESSGSAGSSAPPVSFEDEMWEALQIGVGRSATPPPTAKEDATRRQSGAAALAKMRARPSISSSSE